MRPDEAVAALRLGLEASLPGQAAWSAMLPPWARSGDPARESWREAAVLILIHPLGGEAALPLLLRSEEVPHHPGQIGLPGGAREEGETLEATALRETEEEIGLARAAIEILGSLSRIRIAKSGFSVQPFVGWTASQPRYRLQASEVAGLIELPLSTLLAPGARSEAELSVEGLSRRVPCYRIAGKVVWGATAMILSELAAILGPSSQAGKMYTGANLGGIL